MSVLKMNDHIHIKPWFQTTVSNLQSSQKAPNQDLKDLDGLKIFKIKI